MDFLSTRDKAVLLTKATQNLTYLVGNKRLSPPAIIWLMTRRCNLTCKHCTSYLDRKKIDTVRLMEIAKKLAASKTMIIHLTGGEPLIVPNIQEIITLLKQSGKKVMINTNGYNLEKHADFLIDLQVESITVSIDGADAETHDEIRGKIGSFDKAVENLRYIKENRKGKYPYTAVRGVVMKENFKMLPNFISIFNDIVDDVKFQPVHDLAGHHEVVEDEMLFDSADLELETEFNETMAEAIRKFPSMNTNYYKKFSRFIFHPELMEKEALHSCLPQWMNFMAIEDDGRCMICSKEIGNINDDDVSTIWSGPKRLDFLRSLAQYGKCNTPCWLNCTKSPTQIGQMVKVALKPGTVSQEGRESFLASSNYNG